MPTRGVRRYAHLEVFGNQPGLECRKQQRGGNSTEDAPYEEDAEVVEMLRKAAQDVRSHVGQPRFLSAPVIAEQKNIYNGVLRRINFA